MNSRAGLVRRPAKGFMLGLSSTTRITDSGWSAGTTDSIGCATPSTDSENVPAGRRATGFPVGSSTAA